MGESFYLILWKEIWRDRKFHVVGLLFNILYISFHSNSSHCVKWEVHCNSYSLFFYMCSPLRLISLKILSLLLVFYNVNTCLGITGFLFILVRLLSDSYIYSFMCHLFLKILSHWIISSPIYRVVICQRRAWKSITRHLGL